MMLKLWVEYRKVVSLVLVRMVPAQRFYRSEIWYLYWCCVALLYQCVSITLVKICIGSSFLYSPEATSLDWKISVFGKSIEIRL
jgi:hypothetical protein